MKSNYVSKPWAAVALLWLLLGTALSGRAQAYYTLNDGLATTTLDQLRRVNPDGTNDVLIKDNFVQSAGPVVVDLANNRVLVADTRVSQASTSLTNTKIVAVSLAAGNAVTTLITPAFITGSTSTVISGLALDKLNNYLYYTLNDGLATTTLDQLRRVNLDGTNDVLIKNNFVQSAGTLELDAANNRVLVADTRVSQASTSLTNTKIVAVSLAAGNAVTTLVTPAFITGSTSTVVADLMLDKVNSILYYTLNDGGATDTRDQLRRVNLNGTNDVLIKDNFVQSAGPAVIDLANNRVLVANTRVSQASTSLTNTKIVAVSLAAGNAVTTLVTPAFITGSTSTVVTVGALPEASTPTVTTAMPTSIAPTSAVLGGNVTADGGATVTDRGVVYSSSNTTPTTADTKAANGTGTGTFSATIGSLTSGTTYYVRAYAINSAGISYGSAMSFTTTPNAPVVIVPANGSLVNTTTPAYAGTAVAASTVTVYVDGSSIGTTTATAGGNWSISQPVALAQGSHTVYATAQSSGSAVSANSNTNAFTVDTVRPTVAISSTTAANGGTTSTTPFAYSVTFSEVVTGFVAGDVTVTNGTLSGFAGSGTTYTFTVTPTTAGTVTTVNVPANVAQDAAGNGNTAAPSAYSLTYNAPVTATTWTGAVSTDWFTTGNWTAGVPTTTLDATIPVVGSRNYPAIAAGTASSKSLTVNSGATVNQTGGTLDVRADLTNSGTFTPTGGTVVLGTTAAASVLGSSAVRFWNLRVDANGAQLSTSASTSVQRLLTLNGSLTTNANPLTLESTSATTAMVVNNGGTVLGTATVQRYIDPSINPGLGYRHYSSPVQSTSVADLATSGFSPAVNPAYNTLGSAATPFPTVFGYDEARLSATSATTQSFDQGWFSPAATTDVLNPGRGYTVNLNASEKVDLVGTLNNGTVPVGALSRGTETNAGWQLLGNPYPAPLDWNVARTGLPTGVLDAIYVFKSATPYTGSYQFYQNGFGTLPGGLLPSMQGFFLRVSQNVPAFSFQNSWRSTGYQNPTFNRGTADTRPAVQLDLVTDAGTHEPTFVYFENGATAGFDVHFDAEKLSNSTGLNLSSEIAGGQRLAVNGLPVLGTASLTVPLTVGVPAAGPYTLSAPQLLNLGTTPVYLRDRLSGAVVDLAQQPSYRFVVSNASALIGGRFELVFSPQAALATAPAALAAQVGVYPNPASTTAFVELPATLGRVAVAAELVDALGRTVRTQSLPAQGGAAHRLDLANLAMGLYTLHLNTSAGVVVKKLVVE